MTIPAEAVEAPEQVLELAARHAPGAELRCVWLNDLGGMTFHADAGEAGVYLKHGPRNLESAFRDEAERMTWAGRWIRVPEVLEHGADDTHEWLVTRGIAGRSAVDPRWIAEPAVAVRAIGEGLRAMHDRLPVPDCPWEWSVPARIANAARRGIRIPAHLQEPPPIDRLVVCHGDACAPNTLLDDAGRWVGHVDLAALGVADRWADIAVASMSTAWNYGPGWEDELIAAYGIEPDRERLAYYRELWNAG